MHRIGLVGTNYRYSDLTALEPFLIEPDAQPVRVPELAAYLGVDELVYLSTCNRVEWIYAAREPIHPHAILAKIFAFFGLPPARPETESDAPTGSLARCPGHLTAGNLTFYTFSGDEAISHLFHVASALDSMMLGEAQILGQVKEAYQRSSRWGLAGTELNLLFESAFKAAKKVRSETALAARPLSIASLASDVIERHFGPAPLPVRIRGCVVGAGPMSRKTARYLKDRGDVEILFVNRTLVHAEALAREFGGTAAGLADFLASPAPFDFLVTATGSPEALFDAERLAAVLGDASRKLPLLVLDLALPRDVHPSLDRDPRARVVSLSDLRAIADENRAARTGELEKARPILLAQIDAYRRRRIERSFAPAASRLVAELTTGTEAEVDRLLARELAHLSEADRAVLREWSRKLAERLSRIPIASLKDLAARGRMEVGPVDPEAAPRAPQELSYFLPGGADAALPEVQEFAPRLHRK
jgi:glutamyl-tRNA reductase